MTYDKGYFYPGPAVKNVPLSMAPKESQDAIKEFGRPEYDKWLAEVPAHAAARSQGAGRGVPHLGPAGRRAEDEVASFRRAATLRSCGDGRRGGKRLRRRRTRRPTDVRATSRDAWYRP